MRGHLGFGLLVLLWVGSVTAQPSRPGVLGTPSLTAPPHITERIQRMPRLPRAGAPAWRRLGSGGAFGWYFSHATIESTEPGRLYHTWHSEMFMFDFATGTWSTIPTNGPNIGWMENFGSDDDPVNHWLWIGPGSPGLGDLFTFTPSTSTYTSREAETTGGCGANAVHAWHQNALYCWAGWSDGELKRKITSPNGPWMPVAVSGRPAVTQSSSRATAWRGGVNRRQSYLWTIGDNNELWTCPLANQTCAAWSLIPTTNKPTPMSLYGVYALDEARQKIVGWVGQESVEGGTTKPHINQTYVLDLATRTWSLGPGPTETHPYPYPQSTYIPLSDRLRGRVLLLAKGTQTGLTDVWTYEYGDEPPPPTTPTHPTTLTVSMTGGITPPPMYPLTLHQVGTGTVAGAGSYSPQATVTLTATPATGWTFTSWGPAPCAPTFPMPNAALTCTATFVEQSPPPATCLITAGQFVPCELPADTNASPFRGGSKDVAWTYDATRNRLVVGTGDFNSTYANDSGNSVLFSYVPGTNSWGLVSAYCHPPGQVSLAKPTDRGPLLYDPSRDALWLWNPIPNATEGAACTVSGPPGQPTGSTYKQGTLRYSAATQQWTWMMAANHSGSAGGRGAYDATTDSALIMEPYGNCAGGTGSRMVSVALATLVKTALAPLCLMPSPPWASGAGGWTAPYMPERTQWAWNPATRTAYVAANADRQATPPASGIVESLMIFAKYERATNTWTRLADPPLIASSKNTHPLRIVMTYDSVHHKVVWPAILRIGDPDVTCSWVDQFLVYDIATNVWTSVPVPFEMHADVIMYSPADDVHVMSGGAFCAPGNDSTHLWLYRVP
jgi:hypothetical protein